MLAGPQEVRVQRVQRAIFDRAIRSHDRLRRHQPAEQAPLALAGVTEEEIAIQLLELQLPDEPVDLGLRGWWHVCEV